MAIKWVNLTPHAISVADAEGQIVLTVQPSGSTARCKAEVAPVDSFDGIEVVKSTFGPVEGLPESQKDTVYIVSSMVAQQVSGRTDVVAPDTGPTAIREEGQVKAVKRFQRF